MRYDKSLPATLKIGFRKIRLETLKYDREFHSQMGIFSSTDDRITICITSTPVDDANTLIHEIMHVIYDQYQLDDDRFRGKGKDSDMVRAGDQARQEERIVNSMANGITEVLSRNPKVAAWIMERLK